MINVAVDIVRIGLTGTKKGFRMDGKSNFDDFSFYISRSSWGIREKVSV